MRRRKRRGVVLLEALVALLILGTASALLIGVTRQSAMSLIALRATDADVADASGLLHAVLLWPDSELRANLGVTRQERFNLRLRDRGAFCDIAVLDSFGTRVLLETTHYRGRVSE